MVDDKSDGKIHKGFKKIQWFKQLTDALGNVIAEIPLNDAVCSILNNAQMNFKSGASKLKEVPIGNGLMINIETMK